MSSKVIDTSDNLWLKTIKKMRHDIYHLPEYLELEAKRTQTYPEAFLLIDGEKIFFIPYLLRQCDRIFGQSLTSQEIVDLVSPYGYPGILLSEAAIHTPGFPDLALEEFKRVLKSKNVCSAFLRLNPLLNSNFPEIFQPDTFTENGETISLNLKLSEAQNWSQTRKDRKSKINKCKRLGFTAKMVTLSEYIDEFTEIYLETMNRVKASTSYLSFNYEYFRGMQDTLKEKLHLCIVEIDRQIACAGLYTESCGIVQGTFAGTKNNFVSLSPSVLEIDYARLWAKERGNDFLHLGGGLGGLKDSVYEFKAGFSKQRHSFLTLRLILNQEQYSFLVQSRAKFLNTQPQKLLQSNFFPAYRFLDIDN